MSMILLTAEDEFRFWKKVDKAGPIPAHQHHLGACWSWTKSVRLTYAAGGGTFRAIGELFNVHGSTVWLIVHGKNWAHLP